MRWIAKWGLGLAMVSGVAQAAPQPADPAKSPEQAANLFLAAMLVNDKASIQALNDYLRPAHKGEDAFDPAFWVGMGSKFTGALAGTVEMKLDIKGPERDRVATTFAQSIASALRRSICHATNSRIMPDAAQPGRFVARVNYECLVPDASKAIRALGIADDARPTADVMLRQAAALNAAPADKPITATIDLQAGEDRQYWSTMQPTVVVSAVIDGIVGDLAS